MTLREGWNFTADICNQIEMYGRHHFGFTDAQKVNPTIFESAAISMGNFVTATSLLLRKVSKYETVDDVGDFESKYKEFIGMNLIDIGKEKSNEIMEEFDKIYSKYNPQNKPQ